MVEGTYFGWALVVSGAWHCQLCVLSLHFWAHTIAKGELERETEDLPEGWLLFLVGETRIVRVWPDIGKVPVFARFILCTHSTHAWINNLLSRRFLHQPPTRLQASKRDSQVKQNNSADLSLIEGGHDGSLTTLVLANAESWRC